MIEGIVVGGSTVLLAMAAYWRGKSHFSAEKTSGYGVANTINRATVSAEKLRVALMKFLQKIDGVTDALREVVSVRDELVAQHAKKSKRRGDLQAGPWADLEEAGVNLEGIQKLLQGGRNRHEEIKASSHRIEAVYERLRAAGRIDDHGRFVDTTGLAPEVVGEIDTLLKGCDRVVDSDVVQTQPEIKQRFDGKVAEYNRRYAELEPRQDIEPKPLDAVPGVDAVAGGQSLTDEVATVRQPGNTVTSGEDNASVSPVPVDRAVGRLRGGERTVARNSQDGGSSKKQGQNQK